jgi:hypothetical protein
MALPENRPPKSMTLNYVGRVLAIRLDPTHSVPNLAMAAAVGTSEVHRGFSWAKALLRTHGF